MSDEPRKQPGVAREYRNDDIVVYWEPKLCIHSGHCVSHLPQVFNVDARPWVNVDAEQTDKIAEAVMLCPTGALRFERRDGGPQEAFPDGTTISERPNGPLFVRGRVRIMGADGELIREAPRAALCRCGQSQNKPFCDLSHRKIGFRTTDAPDQNKR